MRNNYVLIDFENVQPTALARLDFESLRVMVFVGASQNKLSFDPVAALQKLGDRAEYIKIKGNGSNALDFHIAYYIGKISAQDPSACFHIISKDTGFDPLIQHLRDQRLPVFRFKDVSEVPDARAMNATTFEEKRALVLADLHRRGDSKPRTLKTLESTIDALFARQLGADELSAILKSLQDDGLVAVNEGKLVYSLPDREDA